MNDTKNLKELLDRLKRRLQKLKEQKASFGLHAHAHILTEIDETEDEIRLLEKKLGVLKDNDIKTRAEKIARRKKLMRRGIEYVNKGINLDSAESAIKNFQIALELSQEMGDPFGEIDALRWMGFATDRLIQVKTFSSSSETEFFPDPMEYFEKAVEVARYNGIGVAEAETYNIMGDSILEPKGEFMSSHEPDYDKALYYYNEALVVSRDIKDRLIEGWALLKIGRIYISKDDEYNAWRHLSAAESIVRELKSDIMSKSGNFRESFDALEYAIFSERERANQRWD